MIVKEGQGKGDAYYSWEAVEKRIQERMRPKLALTLLEKLQQGADQLRNIPERER